MVEIVLSEDCGNSPKNQFVASLTSALAQGDIPFILNKVTEDIRWETTGNGVVEGKEPLMAMLKHSESDPVERLVIHHALTHGKTGAVNGRKTLSSGRKTAFCLVFEFQGAKAEKIQAVTVYEIELSA